MTTIDTYVEWLSLFSSNDPEKFRSCVERPIRLELQLQLARKGVEEATWIVRNKHVSVEVLRTLSASSHAAVRWEVASKRRAPPDVLRLLAVDPEPSVRERIAMNRKAPLDIIERLASDPEGFVARAARRRLSEK